MQVSSHHRQEGAINCGLFAGLQAEVLSRHVVGRVRMAEGGLTCEGAHPRSLQEATTWFTENDVLAARVLLRAAALAFWTNQSPGCDKRVAGGLVEAKTDLESVWLGPVPEQRTWWCEIMPCENMTCIMTCKLMRCEIMS